MCPLSDTSPDKPEPDSFVETNVPRRLNFQRHEINAVAELIRPHHAHLRFFSFCLSLKMHAKNKG